jgi:hypothetical protein
MGPVTVRWEVFRIQIRIDFGPQEGKNYAQK